MALRNISKQTLSVVCYTATITGFQVPFDRREINHKTNISKHIGLFKYLLDKPTAVIMTIHWLPLVEKEIITADSLSVSLSVSETMTVFEMRVCEYAALNAALHNIEKKKRKRESCTFGFG